MPKISVILPIYNVAAYLPKCLDSLLNQTLSDIEIICVDDSSADNSLSILQDYAAKDTRIVVLTQPNSGPGVARNKGIMIAKGEYICFADADDWFETNAFEKLYNVAVEYNADLVECGLTTHDEKNGKTKVRINLYSEKEIDVVNNKEIASYLFSGVSAAWNKMCRTELLKKHNIFFSEGRCAEDTIFTVGVRLFAKKIVSLNLPLYNYLQRSTSLTHKKSKSNLEVPVFLGDVVKLLQREGRFDEVSTQFCWFAASLAAAHYRKVPTENQDEYKNICEAKLPAEAVVLFQGYSRKLSFWDRMFSCYYNGKVKVINIFGISIKIK